MSPEAQRIAIAEACGWTGDRYHTLWTRPDKKGRYYLTDELPDYLNDLNAMHGAVQRLTGKQYRRFIFNLCERVIGNWCGEEAVSDSRTVIEATAAQRAEAFLRALNLWDDGK